MIFEMKGDMIRFGRGYSLNDVVYIDNVRHECVRWTRQMKDGEEVNEFELVPMAAPVTESAAPVTESNGTDFLIPTVFIDEDYWDEDYSDEVYSDEVD